MKITYIRNTAFFSLFLLAFNIFLGLSIYSDPFKFDLLLSFSFVYIYSFFLLTLLASLICGIYLLRHLKKLHPLFTLPSILYLATPLTIPLIKFLPIELVALIFYGSHLLASLIIVSIPKKNWPEGSIKPAILTKLFPSLRNQSKSQAHILTSQRKNKMEALNQKLRISFHPSRNWLSPIHARTYAIANLIAPFLFIFDCVIIVIAWSHLYPIFYGPDSANGLLSIIFIILGSMVFIGQMFIFNIIFGSLLLFKSEKRPLLIVAGICFLLTPLLQLLSSFLCILPLIFTSDTIQFFFFIFSIFIIYLPTLIADILILSFPSRFWPEDVQAELKRRKSKKMAKKSKKTNIQP